MKFLLFLVVLVFNYSIFSQEVVLSKGHTQGILACAITDNNKFMATGGIDKEVIIWDLISSREFHRFSDNNSRPTKLEFSSNNKFLSALLDDEEVKVWNIETDELIYSDLATNVWSNAQFATVDGNEFLIYLDDNNYVVKVNLSTKEKFVLREDYSSVFMYSKLTKEIIANDINGTFHIYDISTNKKTGEAEGLGKGQFPFSRTIVDYSGKYFAFGMGDFSLRVYDIVNKKWIYNKNTGAHISDISFANKETVLYLLHHGGKIKKINFISSSEELILEPTYMEMGISKIQTHPSQDILIKVNNTVVSLMNLNTKKDFQTIEPRVGSIMKMALDPKEGKYLASAKTATTIQIWDLTENKTTTTIAGFFPVCFSPTGNEILCNSYSIDLNLHNVTNGNFIRKFKTNGGLVQESAISEDGKLVGAIDATGKVYLWEYETGELIKSWQGHSGYGYCIDFNEKYQVFATSALSSDGPPEVIIWDYKCKKLKTIQDQTIVVQDVLFSPDNEMLATAAWDETVNIYNVNDYSRKDSLHGHINIVQSLAWSPDSKLLASAAGNNVVKPNDNSIVLWDIALGKSIHKFEGHNDYIHSLFFDPVLPKIFSCAYDGVIKVWGTKSLQEEVSLVSTSKDEFVMLAKPNFYMASKTALDGISVRIKNDLVPFEDFDIRYNRPDIVAKKLGKSSDNLIRAYEYVYAKRAKRAGIDPNAAVNWILPKVEITNQQEIPLVTENDFQEIKFSAWDDSLSLLSVEVYVNKVPSFTEFVSSNPGEKKSFSTKLNLINGENLVDIVALNEFGNPSIRKSFRIVSEQKAGKSKLFILSVGVSDYAQSQFNLKYAAKDATDMMRTLSNTNIYREIDSLLLINKDATKTNILAAQEFLSEATTNDVVIVFFAGHGLLDEDFNYFFATSDIDFEHPSENGISYTFLDEMLSLVKAQRKLLIMDTCHSGEVDEDEIEQGEVLIEQGDVEFRAINTGIRKKNAFGSENTTKLMEELFSNVKSGSGATVIASSGGAEFSMESEEWKNGLFTYSLLKALTSTKTEKNNVPGIQVSEWRAYAYESVLSLSKGLQQPTARSENLILDFRIR